MYRGCISDDTRGSILCQSNKEYCFKCNTTECNYLQSFQLNNPIPVYQYKYPSENSSNGLQSLQQLVFLIASTTIILKIVQKSSQL